MHPPATIIAEVGSVHDGSFGNALKLIALAKECGAQTVKFQTHLAEAETLPDAPMPPYFQGEPRFAYFKRTAFPFSQWKELKQHCESIGIEFMSSPFSIEAMELLENIGMERYKVPSGELTNIPLLERIAATKKPVLLSSGMSSWEELDQAVATIRRVHSEITVLQCTSEYPCPPEHVGLNVITEMSERYKLPVGFSDHSLTNEAAFVAVSLGATVIEKHLTFSRKMYGSDAPHSLEPAEFAELVRGVRSLEKILGSPMDKSDLSRFRDMKRIFEKSVASLVAIPEGTLLTEKEVGCRKPGGGIPASRFREILGKKATRAVPALQLLSEQDFA
ncbi:MAG: N-acetylneuraminate synthase family protein [Patescibacteria group bacterium]